MFFSYFQNLDFEKSFLTTIIFFFIENKKQPWKMKNLLLDLKKKTM